MTKRRLWRPIAAGSLLLLTGLWGADKLFPLPLPGQEAYSRIVTDRHGEPLRIFTGKDGIYRHKINLDQVSDRYLEALIHFEDRHFYRHPGINPLSLLRAAVQYLQHGRIVSGGSTLTMQVARILDPHQRTLGGKAKQILRALQLEYHLSKGEILSLYINHAPFGGNIEGIEAAARSYLQKSARHLTHGESALLTVLPQSPSRLRPDRHPQRAQKARDKVLARMTTFGVWPPSVTDEARLEVVYADKPTPPMVAPLLARRLINQHPQQVIQTGIDRSLQQTLQDLLLDHLMQYPNPVSASALVMENRTGLIRAYLGSASFASATRFGYVDMVRAIRSPGSTLKPFLFGLAIDEGLIHSHSLLSDTPRIKGDYRPSNFDQGFNGPVTATDALQRSLNLPSVQLLDHYGPQRFAAHLRHAGLELIIPGDGKPTLSVILGGTGIRLKHLVGLYSALARGGNAIQPRSSIDEEVFERRLFSPGTAWITYRTLADNPQGEFAPQQHFIRRGELAWKTGTSYGYRDAWAMGVNKDYTIGVWVGRPDGTPSPGQYGRVTAAPLLFRIAAQLPQSEAKFVQPKNVSREAICHPLGTLKQLQQDEWCHQEYLAWLLDGAAPPTLKEKREEVISVPNPFPVMVDTANGLRLSSDCQGTDPQWNKIALWPKQMEPWLPQRLKRSALIPSFASHCKNNRRSGTPSFDDLVIADINDGNSYQSAGPNSPPPRLKLSAHGGQGKRYWYINGRFNLTTAPDEERFYELTQQGQTEITVIDEAGNVDKKTVSLEPNNQAY